MKYYSNRLGAFDLQDNEIVHFPEGLYGFEHETRFGILPFDPKIDCPLKWLQSLDNPDLAFVVTDPFLFHPDYNVTISEGDRELIDAGADDPLYTLVIVKIPDEYVNMTANLVAPVIINTTKLVARQFVLSTPNYDTQHFLFPEEQRQAQTTA